jgi:hypothetical protein
LKAERMLADDGPPHSQRYIIDNSPFSSQLFSVLSH